MSSAHNTFSLSLWLGAENQICFSRLQLEMLCLNLLVKTLVGRAQTCAQSHSNSSEKRIGPVYRRVCFSSCLGCTFPLDPEEYLIFAFLLGPFLAVFSPITTLDDASIVSPSSWTTAIAEGYGDICLRGFLACQNYRSVCVYIYMYIGTPLTFTALPTAGAGCCPGPLEMFAIIRISRYTHLLEGV